MTYFKCYDEVIIGYSNTSGRHPTHIWDIRKVSQSHLKPKIEGLFGELVWDKEGKKLFLAESTNNICQDLGTRKS